MATVIHNRKTSRAPSLPDILYGILPTRLIAEIEACEVFFNVIEEIRVRRNRRASLTVGSRNIELSTVLCGAEMDEMLLRVSGNSLYAHEGSIKNGYVTLDGGIRVGIVGRAALDGDRIIGIYDVSAMSVRLPHRIFPSVEVICKLLRRAPSGEGVLVYAPPGVGKTTLLRSVAREMASGKDARRVTLIDTRGELGFSLDLSGLLLDVMTGYPRATAVGIAARTMSSQLMICDEIGDEAEAEAMVAVQNCGVPFVASAHADSIAQLMRRSAVRRLHGARLFCYYVRISRDGEGGFDYAVSDYEEASRYF